jgi:hypothetical protein
MKRDKNKIQEPYPPEHTPSPPQTVDPRGTPGKAEQQPAGKANEQKPEPDKNKKQEKPKLLGESETEIDDETTI